jgi:hypothetical protein
LEAVKTKEVENGESEKGKEKGREEEGREKGSQEDRQEEEVAPPHDRDFDFQTTPNSGACLSSVLV